MRDIANKAGVSQPTVSLVLSGRTDVRIPESTRLRVIEVATAMRYRLDGTARNLAAGRTNAIAFVYDASAGFLLDDPFCRGIFSAVMESTERENLSLIFSVFDASTHTVSAVERKLVDGVLYLAAKSSEALQYLRESHMPFVVLNPDIPCGPGITTVTLDDFKAGGVAARHVKAAGHRKALFVAPAWRGHIPPSYAGRIDGFKKILPDTTVRTYPLDGRIGDSYRVGLAAGREPFDATVLVAVSDQVAWGIIDALAERGIRAPDDVSVVGFEGLDRIYRSGIPTTATVRFDRAELGRAGVGLIQNLLAGARASNILVEPRWHAAPSLGSPPLKDEE
jgi:LacI family transcriptional regulator